MLRCLKNTLEVFIFGTCLLASTGVLAITVQNANGGGATIANMTSALTGTGVTISNLTITDPGNCPNYRNGVGRFTSGTTGGAGPVLSEPTGVIVSNSNFAATLATANDSANATNILCNGTTSDADMVVLENGTNNGEYAAIEFDVVPASTMLAIPFQFGSEEFPEYVCTIYTDIVGIFVSGPGITSSTPTFSSPSPGFPYENYAKTAGGDLSSINWVNTGLVGSSGGNIIRCSGTNGSLSNTAYYTDNSNGSTTGGSAAVAITNSNLDLDGFTNTLFQPITVVPGQTYHVKIAVADTQDRTYDSAAFIHPLFSTATFSGFDYGDAPDTYGTLTSSAGPSHGVNSSIHMGTLIDNEITGIPSVGADGDDLNGTDDEDGVVSFPALLSNATTYSLNVSVTNNSGNLAKLVGWIDFDNSGTFESTEGVQTTVATGTTSGTAALTWSGLSGLVTGDTYARFRFSTDSGLSTSTTGSAMSDGEVEDYALPISGLTFTKYVSSLDTTCSDSLQTLTVPVGTSVHYCYTVTNPNASAFTVTASSDDQGHNLSALNHLYAAGATDNVYISHIAGGTELPTGVTTVNNASVTANIAGSSVAVNDSASVTVTATTPTSGVKQLYFDALNSANPNLTRDPTDALVDSQTGTLTTNTTFTLEQGITFKSPFTLTGGNDVVVQVLARRRNGGGSRTIRAELYNVNGGALIGVAGSTSSWNAGGWQTIPILVNIPADVTLATGDALRVELTNTGGDVQLRTINGATKAQLQIQTSTVINVDSAVIYAAPYPSLLKFSSYDPGKFIYVRSVVTDPFGSADITSANLTITDAASGTPVNNVTLPTAASTPSSKTFEYAYDLSSGPAPVGFWSVNVTANEGYEASITHTNNVSMIVGLPDLTISKSSEVIYDPINIDKYKALPGAIVEYTISVDNTGYGYVDDNKFIITDPVPAGTTLFFGQNPPVPFVVKPIDFIDGVSLGAETSGLSFTLNLSDLSDALDDVEFYNAGGTVLVTPTYDANGYDTTSPPIDLIRINPKGELKGSNGTTNPTLQFKFRVRVE